jgi:hypothetical protein
MALPRPRKSSGAPITCKKDNELLPRLRLLTAGYRRPNGLFARRFFAQDFSIFNFYNFTTCGAIAL